MSDRIKQLSAAIAEHQREGDKLRAERDQASAHIGKDSANAAVYVDQIIAVTAKMQRVTTVQDALQVEVDKEAAAADEQRWAAALKAVESQKARVLAGSSKRLACAKQMAHAGDALVEAIAAWRRESDALRDDARDVLCAQYKGDIQRISEHLMHIGPAASGTTNGMAQALAAVFLRAADALASPALREFMAFDTFNRASIGFEQAAALAHETLVDRIGGKR